MKAATARSMSWPAREMKYPNVLRIVAEAEGHRRTESGALELREGEARAGLELRLSAR